MRGWVGVKLGVWFFGAEAAMWQCFQRFSLKFDPRTLHRAGFSVFGGCRSAWLGAKMSQPRNGTLKTIYNAGLKGEALKSLGNEGTN
jgi:hypothetical protein